MRQSSRFVRRRLASATAMLLGLHEHSLRVGAIATLPVFAWEMSLGVWLIVEGFKPSPITAGNSRHVGVDERSPAPAAAAV